jgi:hypothetical protein
LASSSAVFTKLTGNSSLAAVSDLISASQVLLWGFVALAGGVIILLTAVCALVFFRRWPLSRSRKFEATSVANSSVAADSSAYRNVDSWDLLSHGTDPTIE